MISRDSVSASPPDFYQPVDLRAVLDAALGIAVTAWVRIRRRKLLQEVHRRDEPRTAGLLYLHMVQVERERRPRRPKMKIKSEVGTFSADDVEIADGRIDIEIIYSLDDEPDLRLECKRVSSSTEDGRARLARYYVDGGVLRFVGDKYGRGHSWGVLVALVVDGRSAAAARLIADYVSREVRCHLLVPFENAGLAPRRHLFKTEHRQGDGPRAIRLLHLFLPFSRRLKTISATLK